MIIKKFEEQAARFPGKLAVKSGNKSLTYNQLNEYANRVANEIIRVDENKTPGKNSESPVVSLLFGHDPDAVVGIIGALKANRIYVPLDVNHPRKRLLYMLAHSDSSVLLTNKKNRSLAEALAAQSVKKIRILTIDEIGPGIPCVNIEREVSGDRPAYILYTSGSTGHPKGVVQSHQNILYFIHHWTQRFSITPGDRITLLASLTHDGAVPDIYASLLNGAALYPYDIKEKVEMTELERWLNQEKITIWHSVPTFYRYFTQSLTGQGTFPHLRLVILGGEEVRKYDVMMFKSYFPNSIFANIYGQTESTVTSIWLVSRPDSFEKVIIGEPIEETDIVLVDDNGDVVEEMGVGEIVIASEHAAPGYWKDKKLTEEVFTYDDEMGRLYWSGDLGRLTAEGSIVMEGRKDFQTKIRGFRVETGEIESVLLQHEAVKEAVTIAKADENGDNYLCAYIVTGEPTASRDLREFLAAELPDYMIPRYLIPIETMPLTPNGKIDRQGLPEPEEARESESIYEAPRSDIEREVAAIWQEVLGAERIGINDHFLELGGHSLLVISIISKIHQALNVELQLNDIFDNPTIKELSRVIMESKQTILSSIEPVEKKEYYAAAASQKRMFVLNQLRDIGTTYNLPSVMKIEGELDRLLFERIFQELIQRHEALRTSFRMVGGELVQVVRGTIDSFHMQYIDAAASSRNNKDEIKRIIRGLIRPFDLSHAPFLHAGLVKAGDATHLLMLDVHHIISDAASMEVFTKNFMSLYGEEALLPLRIQYKDFSEWQHKEIKNGSIKEQETFWLQQFEGEIPVLNIPTDYSRPEIQSFEGRTLNFRIGIEETKALKKIALEEEVTLFMVILAIYNIMLSKICSQEDIIVGTDVEGRKYPDLAHIIGIFVNTLALRNFPTGEKTFKAFLKEVRKRTLDAFENQEYPFEDLVNRLLVDRDASRNPIFDAMFSFVDIESADASAKKREIPEQKDAELKIEPYWPGNKSAMFDLSLNGAEAQELVFLSFEYSIKLFKKKTIERFIAYFKEIVSSIIKNPDTRIWEIEMVSEEEEKRLLESIKEEANKEFIKDIEGHPDSPGSSEAEFDF